MTDMSNDETGPDAARGDDLLVNSADIVAAFVAQNKVAPDQLPELIRTVHQALASIGGAAPVNWARAWWTVRMMSGTASAVTALRLT